MEIDMELLRGTREAAVGCGDSRKFREWKKSVILRTLSLRVMLSSFRG